MPKAKDKTGKNNAMRENIAHIAARLIAVDGIEDFALAKRKAAHQAGCDDTQNLPTNNEVELALKSYRELYFRDAHPQLLNALRREALQVMRQFERLSPYLVGSVLNGSAVIPTSICTSTAIIQKKWSYSCLTGTFSIGTCRHVASEHTFASIFIVMMCLLP